MFANAYKGGIGNAFDDKRCLSCPAALACITNSLEKQIGECSKCGKLVATVEMDFPDAHWDFSNPPYRVKPLSVDIHNDGMSESGEIEFYSREIYIPKWCPRAKITTEVACEKCCEDFEDLPF